MADINSNGFGDGRVPPSSGRFNGAAEPAPADTREDMIDCVELLFFAYRDFTGGPDEILSQYGFGRAHHRVLHFVHRNPGLRVAQLLDILKITKQSLARVLKELIDKGYITSRAGPEDKRERRLHVTLKGSRLAERLMTLQIKRIEAALLQAGPGSAVATRRFLLGMIEHTDQPHFADLVQRSGDLPRSANEGGDV